jgi:hypothetical protein
MDGRWPRRNDQIAINDLAHRNPHVSALDAATPEARLPGSFYFSLDTVMELDCAHLSLAPIWADEDDQRLVFLIRTIDAIRLCRDGSFEEERASVVLWVYEREFHRLAWEVRDFATAARLADPYSTDCQDEEFVDLVRTAIKCGSLVGVREGDVDSTGGDQTMAERRLVRSIEKHVRGRLSEGGRQYKLVAGQDLPGIPDRNSYEVVGREEAIRVLGELGKQAGADVAALLIKARDQLTPDWRSPLSPKGLVLLRRIYAPSAMVASQEPALTPSQLWGKKGKEDDEIIDWTIWIELDPADPKASDDVVILLDEFHQEVMRKPLASCPREGTGVLVKFEKIAKHDVFTLIRDYGPNEGGGQDTLFISSSPAEMDERGSQAS